MFLGIRDRTIWPKQKPKYGILCTALFHWPLCTTNWFLLELCCIIDSFYWHQYICHSPFPFAPGWEEGRRSEGPAAGSSSQAVRTLWCCRCRDCSPAVVVEVPVCVRPHEPDGLLPQHRHKIYQDFIIVNYSNQNLPRLEQNATVILTRNQPGMVLREVKCLTLIRQNYQFLESMRTQLNPNQCA
jgi:hypothetical protein